MTEWIKDDIQIKEADLETEQPETTTKGEMIVADPNGKKLKNNFVEKRYTIERYSKFQTLNHVISL